MNTEVIILDIDGTETPCEPDFAAIKKALDDAFMTPIRVPNSDELMFVDQEGLMKALPVNMHATRRAGQAIVGKVAVVPAHYIRKVLIG